MKKIRRLVTQWCSPRRKEDCGGVQEKDYQKVEETVSNSPETPSGLFALRGLGTE